MAKPVRRARRDPNRPGGLCRAVPSQEVGRCGFVEHDGYGAMCMGCMIAMCREERAFEREECARIAETMGAVGKRIALVIRESAEHRPDQDFAAKCVQCRKVGP